MSRRKRRAREAAPVAAARGGRSGISWWIAAALAAALIAGYLSWTRQPAQPAVVRTADQNVLLITIDTLRADALGCYGGVATTPALDRLAAAGTRYTFAHAHAPVTLVSHASILSGLYPFAHGVHDNSGFRFPASIPTIAMRLAADGFATGAFVGAFPLDAQFGLGAGFDVYDDRFDEAALPSDFTISERPATAVVTAARPWIAGQRGRWFAWIHVFDPHAPYDPPEPFASRYAGNPYAGEVASTDAALAPLLDSVWSRTDRPTLVIVTGDHGEALGDHGEQTHGVFAYEATLRVPLIVAQIGGKARTRAAGTVSRDLVRHVDILPTIIDALGGRPDPALPGRSLLGPAPTAPAVSYFEALSSSLNRGWAPLTGVIVGHEKLVDLPLPELYDLSTDPGEQQNLIDRRPARRRALEADLRGFAAAPTGARRQEDPETRERLRALGYVAGRPAAHRGPYSEGDDPKRLIELDRTIHQAIARFQKGDADGAIALYRDVIEQRPGMAAAYDQLAFVYWETGRRAAAIAALKQAVDEGIADSTIETKLGMYLTESGRAGEGLPWLERAASDPAPDRDALNALAIGYATAGQPDRALATFRRVLTLDPDNPMAWQNIGSLELQRGNPTAARDAFRRALQGDANWAAAYTGLGVAEQRLDHFDAAIASWKQAIARNPQEFDALYNLVTELAAAGRPAEARPYAEQFVRTAPPARYGAEIERFRKELATGFKGF